MLEPLTGFSVEISGPYRQKLGPAITRLETATAAAPVALGVDADQPKEEVIIGLEERRLVIQKSQRSIRQCLRTINDTAAQWTTYIQTLEGAGQRVEEELYAQWAGEDGRNFIGKTLEAEDVLNDLDSLQDQIKYHLAAIKPVVPPAAEAAAGSRRGGSDGSDEEDSSASTVRAQSWRCSDSGRRKPASRSLVTCKNRRPGQESRWESPIG